MFRFSRTRVRLSALGLPMALMVFGRAARADVASWMFVGAGPAVTANGDEKLEMAPALELASGLGTLPKSGFSFGGVMRLQTHFGDGSDLAVLFRSASSGFVRGGFGVGLDAGGFQRWWGVGSSGVLGAVLLGAPWGITASVGAGVGTNDTRLFSASLGLDLARLFVHRQTSLGWWPMPFSGDVERAR